jgi:hypothetical protein
MDSAIVKSKRLRKNANTTRNTSLPNGMSIAEQTSPSAATQPGVPIRSTPSTGIVAISLGSAMLSIVLNDGRSLTVPYYWYPFLAVATNEEREDYTLEDMTTVWWNALGDGITLGGILGGKPDVSRHAIEWRSNRGYAWLDAWVERGMTAKARAVRDEQLAFLREHYAAPLTPPDRYELREREHLVSASEMIETLAKHNIPISKQRLHQLTRGFTQKKGGKRYVIAPVLEQEKDWVTVHGKVRYTPHSVEHLRERHGMATPKQ